jgi:hypothetical protein
LKNYLDNAEATRRTHRVRVRKPQMPRTTLIMQRHQEEPYLNAEAQDENKELKF